MNIEKYPLLLRSLHWLMALLLIGMLALGLYLEELPKEDPSKGMLMGLHKSFGVIALALIGVRIGVRLGSRVPAPLAALTAMEQRLAQLGHLALYALMLLVPLSGFVMSSANPKRFGVELFGWRLPDLPASEFWSHLAHEYHGGLAWALLLVILVHVAAVIKHRFFDKPGSDVLPRMLP